MSALTKKTIFVEILRWLLVALFVVLNLPSAQSLDTIMRYDKWPLLAFGVLQVLAAVMLSLRQSGAAVAFGIVLAIQIYLGISDTAVLAWVLFDAAAIAVSVRDWRRSKATVEPSAYTVHRLWKVYLVLAVASFFYGCFEFGRQYGDRPFVLWPSFVVGLLEMAGLWGYVFSRRMGWRVLWQMFLPLEIAKWLFAARVLLGNALANDLAGAERTMAWIGLTIILFATPMLVALWRYAYRSSVWYRKNGTGDRS